MHDIGESIVGAWLKEVAKCEFVEYGVKTENQGEIDVVGLSLQCDRAYLCEAVTHMSLSHKPGSVSDIVNKSHFVAITDSNLCVLRQLSSSL